MSSEFPAIESPVSQAQTPPPLRQERPRRSRLFVLILLLSAFVGGIALTLWSRPVVEGWFRGSGDQSAQDNTTQPLLTDNSADPEAAPATTSSDVAALEARIVALTAKLDAISTQAAGAGGNAARAEGLLIAFATRRALDHGAPLGYLEGELRLRFGNAQPRAVATIINAAQAPVTLVDLQAGLDQVSPILTGSAVKRDWWADAKRELASLVIIRKAHDPSPAPQKAIERARMMIAAGRVDAALKEIERLPDHQKADNWLQMARQYNEARRALDVVEAAAVLEPRSVPVTPRAGGPTNMQVAPPPPGAAPTAAPAR